MPIMHGPVSPLQRTSSPGGSSSVVQSVHWRGLRMEWGHPQPSWRRATPGTARNKDGGNPSWRSPLQCAWDTRRKKVDRAQRAVDRAKCELDDFEEEVNRRRDELQEALDQATDRLQERRRQLDDLHKEAGDLAAANASAAGDRRDAHAEDEAGRLRAMVAGELQVFIEMLEEGTEARGKANTLLARLAAAPETRSHQHDSIHTDEEENDAGDGYQTVTRKGRAAVGGQGKGTLRPRNEPTWTPNAGGRWNKQRPAGADEGHMEAAEGGDSRGTGSASSGGQGEATPAAKQGENKPRGEPTSDVPAAPPEGNACRIKGKRASGDGNEHGDQGAI